MRTLRFGTPSAFTGADTSKIWQRGGCAEGGARCNLVQRWTTAHVLGKAQEPAGRERRLVQEMLMQRLPQQALCRSLRVARLPSSSAKWSPAMGTHLPSGGQADSANGATETAGLSHLFVMCTLALQHCCARSRALAGMVLMHSDGAMHRRSLFMACLRRAASQRPRRIWLKAGTRLLKFFMPDSGEVPRS